MLKDIAKHLMAVKERFYEISFLTGTTRRDGWVDIEGGVGTLFAYSSLVPPRVSQRDLFDRR